MLKYQSALVVISLTIACATTPVSASTVVGIFAIIDQVELEPDATAPQRIRISGVFVVPVSVSSGLHRAPARTTLCFTLPPGREDAVLRDWSALKASAGTGQVIGFAEYWVVTARPLHATMNSSLEVNLYSRGCQPYPVPNKRGVVTTFDTMEDAQPRFGEPSMAIVAKLLASHRR